MGCRAMPSTTAITVMMRAMMISRIMSSFEERFRLYSGLKLLPETP